MDKQVHSGSVRGSLRAAAFSLVLVLGLSALPAPAQPFVHPGLRLSSITLQNTKAHVLANDEPWKSAYNTMVAWTGYRDGYRSGILPSALSYPPQPVSNIDVGINEVPRTGQDAAMTDGMAAYIHAMMWYIYGDPAHAQKTIEICNAWANTLTSITGGNARLAASWIAVDFLEGAEIVRSTYTGTQDWTAFDNMLQNLFYPMVKNFAPRSNGNHGTLAGQAYMSIGVFLNNRTYYNACKDYYLNPTTTDHNYDGSLLMYVYTDGTTQETTRDQEHEQMGVLALTNMCEIAWTQGEDFYSASSNLLLTGLEGTAGRVSAQPTINLYDGWDIAYNHYHYRKNLPTPIMDILKTDSRYSGVTWTRCTNATWPKLTHRIPIPAAPTGLAATAGNAQVTLAWANNTESDLAGYNVYRSTTSGGPFTTPLNSPLLTPSNYTDTTVTNGSTYYYVITAVSTAANESADSAQVSATPFLHVTGVTLDLTMKTFFTVGAMRQLTATVAPANATNKTVTWTSSNPAVATVNSSGLVTAVANGTTTITATTQDGGFTATCAVTVSISVTGVTLDLTTKTFFTVGATRQLTATVAPSNAANKTVTWTSSNPAVATVNSSGLVTAVANGTATITATTQDGGFTATCAVTVSISVTGVTLDLTTKTFFTVGATRQLTATVTPANAANKTVAWTSSNPAVATVNSSGLVTAVANGTTTITATTQDGGFTATCAVTVSISAAPPTFSPAGGTYTSAQSVTISSATTGASIRYTIDGSTPSDTIGTLYTSPVTISTTTTLKAIAYKTGYINSAITSDTYRFFPTIQAESYSSMLGVQTETCSDTGGGQDVAFVHNGDWMSFSGVDITGATGIDIRVSSATSGGTIEVRAGSTTGTLLGTISITGTGSWQTWTTQSATISGASGTQTIVLLCKGGTGYLYNINWLKFK